MRNRRDANTGSDGARGRALGRTRLRQDRLARHPLLQQQLRRLDPRIGVEPRRRTRRRADDVGERDQRHALVMGEKRADDLRRRRRRSAAASSVAVRAAGSRWTRRTRSGRRARRASAARGSAPRPPDRPRLASAVAYGATTRSSARPRFRPRPGHAERAVLIVARAIGEGVGRLRDAPRHAALARRIRSAAGRWRGSSGRAACREAAHQQLRHQVLEHRAAPRHQRRRGRRRW